MVPCNSIAVWIELKKHAINIARAVIVDKSVVIARIIKKYSSQIVHTCVVAKSIVIAWIVEPYTSIIIGAGVVHNSNIRRKNEENADVCIANILPFD